MFGLRDRFFSAGAHVRSAVNPNHSFKTYRFKERGPDIAVGHEFTGRTMYHIGSTAYSWVEANRVAGDKYTLQLVEEIHHGQFGINGDNDRTVSAIYVDKGKDRRSVFSKAEARQLLEYYEKKFEKEGKFLDKKQPFSVQHYSHIRALAVEAPPSGDNKKVSQMPNCRPE